jgi:hypothetical protein
MLRLAQCEKAVTISELMGYSRRGGRVPVGSETPIGVGIPVRGSLACASPGSGLSTSFHVVFNDLQVDGLARGRGLGATFTPIQEGNVVAIRGAQFGPNFVTIQPIGVCVCSI